MAYARSAGYTLVEDVALAEVVVVNTCTFIREATGEAVDTIFDMAALKKDGCCKMLMVCGCFSQRYREQVAHEFPEVDVWCGVDDWENLFEAHLAPPVSTVRRHLSEPLAVQYLKIAEGCSHGCAFCIIPKVRGPFVSRAVTEIVSEARWLYEQGTRECILVSQDTSYYGRDQKTNLVALLETLLKKTAFPWLRLMYLHPQQVTDELLRLIAAEPRICPYFDIPLQHASDAVLRRMKRTPGHAGLVSLIERIRTMVSDSAIRTSFITGFPGERPADFKQLIRFVETMRFDKVGVFPYSAEEGTSAAILRPRVRGTTATRRCEELMTVQRDISAELLAARVGRTLDVMIDRVSDEPAFAFTGRTRYDAPEVDGIVHIASGNCQVGTIVPLTITAADDYDLYVGTASSAVRCSAITA